MEELLEKIISKIANEKDLDLGRIKGILILCMSDYDIRKKETQIIKREENINEEIIRKFLITKRIAGCSERTLRLYALEIRKILLNKIGKNIMEITGDDILKYLAERDIIDKVSKATQQNEWRYLSSFFTWAQKEEIVIKNPMWKVPNIKKPKVRMHAFTEIEVEKMRDACKTEREKAIIEVLLSTGCREMEARNIKLEDIAGNKIKVLGKGNKERFVYLNAKAMVAVERYREKRKDKSPYLFPRCTVRVGEGSKKLIELVESKKGKWWEYEKLVANEPATKGSLNATVRGIGKRVGVEAHAHKFRRTCATWALKHGMPIEQVSMMLGHASVATTQIYLDIKEKDLEISHERYVTG